jgi:RHS repeat-associated protein
MNRMQYVNEGGTNKLLAQYSWDALSRAQSIAYGDSTTDVYSQYDAGDNLKTLTQTYNGSGNSATFSYTWLMNHQLNSAGVNNPLFQYVPQAGTVSYGAADVDNGLSTMTASTGSATMTYDGNHNLSFDGYNTLSYDVENRMVQAENATWCPATSPCTYLYDPLGERKQKTVSGFATDFVLAGGEEVADYYEASATWRLMVRGAGGLPLVTVVPAAGGGSEEIVYVHHDVKGSTVALTVPGSTGPAESYTYSDYGAPQSGSWLAYQYAGYRYDSETGLYYTPARYYSPALGRFLQSDPAGFQGGTNLYAYAGNDPVNLIDPVGLTPDGGEIITAVASGTFSTWFMRALGVLTYNVFAMAQQQEPQLVVTMTITSSNVKIGDSLETDATYGISVLDAYGNLTPLSPFESHAITMTETLDADRTKGDKPSICDKGCTDTVNGSAQTTTDHMSVHGKNVAVLDKRFTIDGSAAKVYDPATKKTYDYINEVNSVKGGTQFTYQNNAP